MFSHYSVFVDCFSDVLTYQFDVILDITQYNASPFLHYLASYLPFFYQLLSSHSKSTLFTTSSSPSPSASDIIDLVCLKSLLFFKFVLENSKFNLYDDDVTSTPVAVSAVDLTVRCFFLQTELLQSFLHLLVSSHLIITEDEYEEWKENEEIYYSEEEMRDDAWQFRTKVATRERQRERREREREREETICVNFLCFLL